MSEVMVPEIVVSEVMIPEMTVPDAMVAEMSTAVESLRAPWIPAAGADQEALATQVARELHDGVAQTLATTLIDLENFRSEQIGRRGVLDEIGQVQASIRDALASIRQLLYDLRGMPAVDGDFSETLRHGLLARFALRTGIKVQLLVAPSWPSELSAHAAVNLYRIVQESLTNIQRHSGARNVWISLAGAGPQRPATVRIRDDGRGFPATDTDSPHGLGMLGMQERALLVGGRVTFMNRPLGKGGMVVIHLDAENGR